MSAMIIQLISAFTGSIGFAMLFNVRGKDVIIGALGGLLAWGVVLLAGIWFESSATCFFVASLVLAVYSEIMARVRKEPALIFIFTAAIPLFPGGALYETMSYAVSKDLMSFLSRGRETLLMALAIAVGILCVTVVEHTYTGWKKRVSLSKSQ